MLRRRLFISYICRETTHPREGGYKIKIHKRLNETKRTNLNINRSYYKRLKEYIPKRKKKLKSRETKYKDWELDFSENNGKS